MTKEQILPSTVDYLSWEEACQRLWADPPCYIEESAPLPPEWFTARYYMLQSEHIIYSFITHDVIHARAIAERHRRDRCIFPPYTLAVGVWDQ